ncbi:hypothetical protein C7S13_5128 [Burkholderia cepacia]|nr:hypothetical protein [Burkholderia cepacia]
MRRALVRHERRSDADLIRLDSRRRQSVRVRSTMRVGCLKVCRISGS